ncbi:MAG: hypothetical protein HRU46_04055 [Verrucomicrobiales bacterium]|nr:hypothetical protein [Verrucomicrobiales bacterium]
MRRHLELCVCVALGCLVFGGDVLAAGEISTDLEERIAAEFPLPEFRPITEVTQNWTRLPEEWIPEFVTVKQDTLYDLLVEGQIAGRITGFAGHRAKVLGFKNGSFTVTHQPDETTRAIISFSDTSLQQELSSAYQDKLYSAEEEILYLRRAARKEAIKAAKMGKEMQAIASNAGDPRFAPVVAALEAGKLYHARLEEARKWIWLGNTDHEGAIYEGVLIHFQIRTIFGDFPDSVICLLDEGEVVKWVDSLTGEARQ